MAYAALGNRDWVVREPGQGARRETPRGGEANGEHCKDTNMDTLTYRNHEIVAKATPSSRL
jgi:hypothetical protein